MKMKKIPIFIVMIGALFVAGCGDDDTEMTNSQPIIDRVIVPEEVKAGEKVKLDVVAHDADGDKLTYNWKVSEGTVNAAGVWTVPAEATRATVLVHVSDSINSSVASSKISVEIVPPSGPIVPKGMVSIPAGEFQMGSNDPGQTAKNNEQPVHTVYVDAFFMDEHEVTNLEYKQFVVANPSWKKDRIDEKFHTGNYLKHWEGNAYPQGKTRHPVVSVSWYAAMAYAAWMKKRLPTEAEWEYAARGGLAGKKYPWGDVPDTGKANYTSGNPGDTTPVGEYPPNGYGLHDMTGNVTEWCLDKYDKDFYSRSPRENPLSGADNVNWFISNFTRVETDRVVRDGSSHNDPMWLRISFRRSGSPSDSFGGFRCARAQ